MKGEFEKRMKDAQQTTPVLVAYPYDEKIQTAVFYNTLKIDRMIDEVKKEFPNEDDYWGYEDDLLIDGDSNKPMFDKDRYDKAMKSWFEKWFGDAEVSEK